MQLLDAERYCRHHVCPDCRGKAVLMPYRIGGSMSQEFGARCGGCKRTDGFEKAKSLTQMWRENPDSVPPTIANRFLHKHGKEIEAMAEGLPLDMAAIVKQKYFGLPSRKGELKGNWVQKRAKERDLCAQSRA